MYKFSFTPIWYNWQHILFPTDLRKDLIDLKFKEKKRAKQINKHLDFKQRENASSSHINLCKGWLIPFLDNRHQFRQIKAVSLQVFPCVCPKRRPAEPVCAAPLFIPHPQKGWDFGVEVQGFLCTVLTYVILVSLFLSLSLSLP